MEAVEARLGISLRDWFRSAIKIGLTQEKMKEILGVSKPTVNKWINMYFDVKMKSEYQEREESAEETAA
jgi:DNA-binding transcriptional regulator YdaS (Cro superfamily)